MNKSGIFEKYFINCWGRPGEQLNYFLFAFDDNRYNNKQNRRL